MTERDGESVQHQHTDECRAFGCIEYAARLDVEAAARRLYEAGQQRARERAAVVDALRMERSHPLVLAVLERWGWEPSSVSDALADQAISAVQAVVNCLGSEGKSDDA